MTVPAFESRSRTWFPLRSIVLVGLLASSSGACSSRGSGAAGTADGGVDANSVRGEAGSGTDSSSSDGAADSSELSDSSGSSSSSGSNGDGGTVCPLPTTFNWTSTGPLAQPQNGWVSIKDFSDVVFNNQHIVYMSTVSDAGSYGGAMMTFPDWPEMAAATQYAIAVGGAAPTLIYFTPKNMWVLMYEFGEWTFSYLTSTDPTNPSGWSSPYDLYQGNAIDETVLCTSATCYLFFADDNGSIYRASMPIGDFPGTFTNATTVMTDSTANLFEAVEVYTVKGANQYLMIVEAIGSTGNRYFRSFTATDLGGSWTPLAATEATPFAGKANVTFTDGGAWTADFSSGDMVRANPDETQTVDPCNLQFLYQGDVPSTGLSYNQIPWQPGLLTLVP
jgi:hypothetical protein